MLVGADDPGACDAPIIMVETCEPTGDTDGDGAEHGCLEDEAGVALGGGACCGDVIAFVPMCTSVIDYCDADDESSCVTVDVPASEHRCEETSYCDAFATADTGVSSM